MAGRPLVYATTEQFLRVFGLNHLSELPDMKTFAAKGPKEIQSDLPFDQAMPPFKDNILPLEENGYMQTESVQIEGQTPAIAEQENDENTENNDEGGTK